MPAKGETGLNHDDAQPTPRGSALRPLGPAARLLVVEPDRTMAAAMRLVLDRNGFSEPFLAEEADEALDAIGAKSQALDLVLMAYSPVEPVDLALIRVLRHVRSPIRLALYGSLEPEDLDDAAHLVGAAGYIDLASLTRIAPQVRALLGASCSIAHIFTTARTPATLSRRWAIAIYGAAPGEPIPRARLDTDHRSLN